MLVGGLMEIITDLLLSLFSGMATVGIDTSFINVLNSILCYGIWVIGPDVFALVISTVVSWWAIKFSIGVVLWVWELLPLT